MSEQTWAEVAGVNDGAGKLESIARFGIWTLAVLGAGAVPWLVGVYLGPVRTGGCANAFGAIGAIVGGLLLLPAVLSPICVVPAIVGYVVAAW